MTWTKKEAISYQSMKHICVSNKLYSVVGTPELPPFPDVSTGCAQALSEMASTKLDADWPSQHQQLKRQPILVYCTRCLLWSTPHHNLKNIQQQSVSTLVAYRQTQQHNVNLSNHCCQMHQKNKSSSTPLTFFLVVWVPFTYEKFLKTKDI